MKLLFSCSLIFLFTSLASLAQSDTISIYFNIGSSEISVLELEKLKVESDWQKVDLVSYTDYLGSEEFNQRLSLYRSYEVRARLVERGLNSSVLGLVEGRGITGERLDSKEGIQENRRTDIVIYFNDKSEEKEEPQNPTTVVPPKVELSEQFENSVVGDQLVLSDLTFIPGQHFLTPSGDSAFAELRDLMKKNNRLKVNIEGHICCNINGEDGLDLATNRYDLSEARAEYIYLQLINSGIDKKRLSYEGFARSKPIFPDELTEEEKKANRRVEIKILEK